MKTKETAEEQQAPSSLSAQLQGSGLIYKLIKQEKLFKNSLLAYILKGDIRKTGVATWDGIKCTCGCKEMYSMTQFEIHAGVKHHRGCDNTYLHDGSGKSLAELRNELESISPTARDNYASDRCLIAMTSSEDQNSRTCDFCNHQTGELLRCHTPNCPATLHVECLPMQNLRDTQAEWYCQKCSCRECGEALCERIRHEGKNENQATQPSISPVSCGQCGDKYHMECLLNKERLHYTSSFEWFCSNSCKEIFEILLGLATLTLDPIYPPPLTVLKWNAEHHISHLDIIPPDHDDGVELKILTNLEASTQSRKAKQANKLFYVLNLLRDSFGDPLHLPGQTDLFRSMLYNHRSAPSRSCLDQNEFYVILLERDAKVITAATIRIHGRKVAEMPFIATRESHRGQGFCVRLMNGLEEILKQLEVQRLVIQSPPQLVPMWTAKHHFQTVDLNLKRLVLQSNLIKLDGTFLLCKNIYSCN